jgi:hypothetical protein
MRVLWAHLQDEPVKLTAKRADLPPEISDVVMQALDKDPANRPETAGEFARMFQAAAGGAG